MRPPLRPQFSWISSTRHNPSKAQTNAITNDVIHKNPATNNPDAPPNRAPPRTASAPRRPSIHFGVRKSAHIFLLECKSGILCRSTAARNRRRGETLNGRTANWCSACLLGPANGSAERSGSTWTHNEGRQMANMDVGACELLDIWLFPSPTSLHLPQFWPDPASISTRRPSPTPDAGPSRARIHTCTEAQRVTTSVCFSASSPVLKARYRESAPSPRPSRRLSPLHMLVDMVMRRPRRTAAFSLAAGPPSFDRTCVCLHCTACWASTSMSMLA
uniref:Uncharacterized protein n=1 Tax=Mycena chlorophos TaxID=658473 RepID=A0ABQ0L7F4_MYCCL|nr:predicted protein [Mycena chlorophos]